MSIVIPTRINQTAAQWAVDVTVYSANKILVTTDVFYGSTDQPKFKLANGSSAWAALDYFPVSGFDDATSSIQTQLNAKKGVIMSLFTHARFNPADSSTYYFGANPSATQQTLEDFGSTICPKTFTAERIKGVVNCGAGSDEDVSFYLTIDGVDTLIETVQLNSTRTLVTNNTINTVITEDTKMSIKMATPPWVTNPTNLTASFEIYGT